MPFRVRVNKSAVYIQGKIYSLGDIVTVSDDTYVHFHPRDFSEGTLIDLGVVSLLEGSTGGGVSLPQVTGLVAGLSAALGS